MGDFLVKDDSVSLAATDIRVNALRAVCAAPVTIQFRRHQPVKPYPDGIATVGVLWALRNFGLATGPGLGVRQPGNRQDVWTATEDGRAALADFDQRQAQRRSANEARKQRQGYGGRLKSAAADMLAALKLQVAAYEAANDPDTSYDDWVPMDDAALSAARAAIAKAEGRS